MSLGTGLTAQPTSHIFRLNPQDHIAQVRASNAQQRAQQAPKPQTAPGGIMPSRPGQPLTRASAATPGRNPQFQGTRTPPPAQQMPPYMVDFGRPGSIGQPGRVDTGYNKQIDNPFGGTIDNPFGGAVPMLHNYSNVMSGGGSDMINPAGQDVLGGTGQQALPGQPQPATSKYQSTLNPGQSAAPTIAGAPAPGSSPFAGKFGGAAPVGEPTAQTNQVQSMPVDQGYLPASQAQTQNQIYPEPYNTSPFNTLATPSAMPQSRMI